LINNLSEAKNKPIDVSRNRPNEQLVHRFGKWQHISSKEIENLAITKYQSCGLGITINDIIKTFHCKKAKAQKKLKFVCKESINKKGERIKPILFTLERTKPQQYFPSCIKATIIENKKNRPIDPTVLNHPYPSPYLEKLKVRNVMELLSLLDKQPISIHKLQLKLFVDKNYYDEIDIKQITKGNKSKPREEKFGPRNVKYEVYPCGTIMIYIACSNSPFKLEVEEDVSSFFSFLGQVIDRLIHFLRDFSEQAIPQIMDWILVQCDINQDIGINIVEQLSLPDLQLRVYDRIFRLYVNSIDGSSYYRIEESRQVNQAVRVAIPEIMKLSNSHVYNPLKYNYIQ
jgi:hypothetical protein